MKRKLTRSCAAFCACALMALTGSPCLRGSSSGTLRTAAMQYGSYTVAAGYQAEYWAGASRSNVSDTSKVMYLFDWGDGTQSLSGNVVPYVDFQRGRCFHTYAVPGTYLVKAEAFDSATGVSSGWSPDATVRVTGSAAAWPALTPKSAAASSAKSGSPASAALDGSTSTVWQSAVSASANAAQWCSFDLGGIRTVNRLKVWPGPGGGFPQGLKVQYSNDGSKWFDLPVHTHALYPAIGTTPQLFETGGIAARYVRLYATKLGAVSGGYAFALGKVELYGTEGTKFYTSQGGLFDADLSNLWTVYGTTENEETPLGSDWWNNASGGVIAFGSTEWFDWDALKLAWTDRTESKAQLLYNMLSVPIESDGYLWSTAWGRLHLDKQKHYTDGADYILGVSDYILWTGNASLLTSGLPALPNGSAPKYPFGVDTLIDKLRLAEDFYLKHYNGADGLFICNDAGYQGLPGTYSTSYLDAYPFGYKDAYVNILMYRATQAMAWMEDALGQTARAAAYRAYLPKMKQSFNGTFWDASKGRYICAVDKNGVRHDLGITVLNFMAVQAGLADRAQARQIYDWVDGSRTVPGDTSTGSSIYAFGYAARTNTKDAASVSPAWWVDTNCFNTDPKGNCYYGGNIQNGGAMLYTSFYDIMGRIGGVSADSGYARLQHILSEFQKDELRRDTVNRSGLAEIDGILDCFPESGLVPLTFLNGFLGISAQNDGLHVDPSLPSSLQSAGVKEVVYHNISFQITADRTAARASVVKRADGSYAVTVPVGKESVITSADSGSPRVSSVAPGAAGPGTVASAGTKSVSPQTVSAGSSQASSLLADAGSSFRTVSSARGALAGAGHMAWLWWLIGLLLVGGGTTGGMILWKKRDIRNWIRRFHFKRP